MPTVDEGLAVLVAAILTTLVAVVGGIVSRSSVARNSIADTRAAVYVHALELSANATDTYLNSLLRKASVDSDVARLQAERQRQVAMRQRRGKAPQEGLAIELERDLKSAADTSFQQLWQSNRVREDALDACKTWAHQVTLFGSRHAEWRYSRLMSALLASQQTDDREEFASRWTAIVIPAEQAFLTDVRREIRALRLGLPWRAVVTLRLYLLRRHRA